MGDRHNFFDTNMDTRSTLQIDINFHEAPCETNWTDICPGLVELSVPDKKKVHFLKSHACVVPLVGGSAGGVDRHCVQYLVIAPFRRKTS